MKRKWNFLVSIICSFCFIFGLTACKKHTHDYTEEVTAPTCTEQGYTTYTCSCGHSYVDTYVDELGHDYTEEVTAPTCAEQGYTTYTCRCGHSYVDDYVPVLKNYYETQVNFFVNPVKETSSSQIINGTYGENVMRLASTVLNQDVFLEQLLLSENGVVHPYIKNYFGILTDKEFALNDLRENSGYNALINKVKDSVSVFYDENVTSFIYVSISVLEDKEFAEFLYNQICEKVPHYLENILPLPTGYDRTVCQKTSLTDEIKLVQK